MIKFGEKIFGKDSLMFFYSYPKENEMAFFFKNAEIMGQSEALCILAPDWSATDPNSQSGARIQRTSL